MILNIFYSFIVLLKFISAIDIEVPKCGYLEKLNGDIDNYKINMERMNYNTFKNSLKYLPSYKFAASVAGSVHVIPTSFSSCISNLYVKESVDPEYCARLVSMYPGRIEDFEVQDVDCDFYVDVLPPKDIERPEIIEEYEEITIREIINQYQLNGDFGAMIKMINFNIGGSVMIQETTQQQIKNKITVSWPSKECKSQTTVVKAICNGEIKRVSVKSMNGITYYLKDVVGSFGMPMSYSGTIMGNSVCDVNGKFKECLNNNKIIYQKIF